MLVFCVLITSRDVMVEFRVVRDPQGAYCCTAQDLDPSSSRDVYLTASFPSLADARIWTVGHINAVLAAHPE